MTNLYLVSNTKVKNILFHGLSFLHYIMYSVKDKCSEILKK
jgi:hypothetical protein